MYINPFVFGILVGVIGEFMLFVIWAVIAGSKKDKDGDK